MKFLTVLTILVMSVSCIKLNNDGEYTQITVKIDDDIPDDDCEELLDNLKVSKDMFVNILSNKEIACKVFTTISPSLAGCYQNQ